MLNLQWTLILSLVGGTTENEPKLPAPTKPPKVAPTPAPGPMLPGDRPGPERPVVGQDEVRVRDAVPDELVYKPTGPAPKRTSLMMLSYRNYATKDHLQRNQAWHVVGFELTPVRRYFRFSLITEVGLEGGEAAANGDRGDFFVMQKVGLGIQYPHWVTPFLEFQGGGGVGRVEMYQRNDLGVYWSMGVDLGAQWSVARRLRLMAAAGWIRPTMMHGTGKAKDAVYYHRGTFKVGVGF